MKYIAFVDGSYKKVANGNAYYGAAAIVRREDTHTWSVMSKASSNEMIEMRNVAGELLAATMLFDHCLRLEDCDSLDIYYDYEGIYNWLKQPGEKDYWQAKKKWTQAYRAYYYKNVKPRIKCNFYSVKSHTGVAGNELVDSLAKECINQLVRM